MAAFIIATGAAAMRYAGDSVFHLLGLNTIRKRGKQFASDWLRRMFGFLHRRNRYIALSRFSFLGAGHKNDASRDEAESHAWRAGADADGDGP